jgi:FSR family fosmidomycin resistance protein-like MFS transporter
MSAGGLGVTLLGMIADTWGVPMALKTIFILPLIGLRLSFLLEYPLKTKER